MSMPSPVTFFSALTAHQLTAAIRSAVELDLFTAIAQGAATPDAIGKRIGAHLKGTRVLCDYLTIHGFLTKADGGYALTQDSAVFLDKRSPAYLGGIVKFLLGPLQMKSFELLTDAVRKGGTALSEEGTTEADHPVWQDFARSMAPLMAPAAEFIAQAVRASDAGPMKVLDIAAGHGLFGIAIAKANPKAEIYAVDWKDVLAVASENARKMGVADRHHTIPGDAFQVDFGSDHDLVLFTNFFHHFDTSLCETLLRKTYASLKPSGRIAILEFVPDENRVSPPMAAGFALTMLTNTKSGDAYTLAEYRSMLTNTGFGSAAMLDLPGGAQRLILASK
jgi:SAM-dependent methyltransferase